jgi:hypothetical protein
MQGEARMMSLKFRPLWFGLDASQGASISPALRAGNGYSAFGTGI